MRILPVSVTAITLALVTTAMTPATAQTVIAADAGNGFDVGTVVSSAGNETTITGGTLAGSNLFHSFARFDLGQGDIAQWVRGESDAASIANVINRVTGDDPSDINGTLRLADMPGAAFWFLNPAGIFFGADSAVDVPGAAYFSTGEELHFADGLSFSTITLDGSTFSSAAPEAFGFLGGQGDIIADSVGQAFSSRGASLAFSAANVTVDGVFETGSLDVTAIGPAVADIAPADPLQLEGTGSITISGPGIANQLIASNIRLAAREIEVRDIKLLSFAFAEPRAKQIAILAENVELQRGSVTLANFGGIDTGGIVLSANRLILREGSEIDSQTSLPDPALPITIAASRLELDDSDIISQTFAGGDAGPISILADDIALSNGAELKSVAFNEGNGGPVVVNAARITASGNALLGSQTGQGSTGNAGDVAIETDMLALDNSRLISTIFGTGDGGFVSVRADEIALSNGATLGPRTGTISSGDGGDLFVQAGVLTLDSSTVSTTTFGSGTGGNLLVQASQIALANDALLRSEVDVQSAGDGGNLLIDTDELILDASTVATSTFGLGNGGNLSIRASQVGLTGDSSIRSTAGIDSTGSAGDITIETGNLTADDSFITGSTFSVGNGGFVTIRANEIALSNSSNVRSETLRSTGNAGGILIEAGRLLSEDSFIAAGTDASGNGGTIEIYATHLIQVGGQINSNASFDTTGRAGDVIIEADRLVSDGGSISTITFGAADGGTVRLGASDIELMNSASVSAGTVLGTGNGGNVIIDADRLSVDDSSIRANTAGGGDTAGDGGSVMIYAADFALTNEAVVSSGASDGNGTGGAVVIETGRLTADASSISSTSFGEGDGGPITVSGDDVVFSNGASVSSQAPFDFASAGDITIESDRLAFDESFIFTTSMGEGDSGAITIRASDISLSGGQFSSAYGFGNDKAGDILIQADTLTADAGVIRSAVALGGTGGTITVEANEIKLLNGTILDSRAAFGEGTAGDISIKTSSLVADASSVSSASEDVGNAGSILIEADQIDLINGGEISTNAGEGPAGDIDLLFPEGGLLRLAGEGEGGTITTSSGQNTGGRITIADPYLILSDGGSILALGEVSGANVRISSDYFLRSADRINLLSVNGDLVLDSQFSDPSAGTEAPDIDFLDASSVLSGQCAGARATGQTSRFSSRVTGPYVPTIEGLVRNGEIQTSDRRFHTLEQLSPCG